MSETLHRMRGFGLLEALVALVLIAGVGFTLLAWVQQNLDTLGRLRTHYEAQEARRMIQDWSMMLNPMAEPEGEITLGGMRLRWQSEQEGDKRTQSGYPAGMGLYDVALFKVRVDVYRPQENTPWISETLTRAGYYKARTFKPPI